MIDYNSARKSRNVLKLLALISVQFAISIAVGGVVYCDYIAISGAAQDRGVRLLTDYIPRNNTVIRAKYASASASSSNNNQFLFCSRSEASASTGALNFCFAPNVNGTFRFDYYASQTSASASFTANRDYELLVRDGVAYVTDTVEGTVTELGPGLQSFAPGYRLALFQSYVYKNGEETNWGNSFHGRFYYLKIYEIEDGAEVLKHDFVPCIEDGVIKLCDLAVPGKPCHSLTEASGSVSHPKSYTVAAPDGIGDVVSLTNLLTNLNAFDDSVRNGSKVWLKPGVYNLDGVYMSEGSHLVFNSNQGGIIAGLGERREDTVLLGGGERGAHRVMSVRGANYGWMTVSNLTVTGGWTEYDGGGIEGNASTRYSHCIISNNYAHGSNGGGGGGSKCGRAEYCLFADNRAGLEGEGNKWGGGFWTNGGGGLMASIVQGAWNCVFSNNWASGYGGGMHLSGKCEDCVFSGNSANHGGAVNVNAASFTWGKSAFTNTVEIKDCNFERNTLTAWGYGSAVYNSVTRISVSNCVFTANDSMEGGEGVIYNCNMYDCIVTNNSRSASILYNCNLERCVVSGNTVSGRAGQIDAAVGHPCTNVNCVFSGNVMSQYGRISNEKTFINCTIVGNDSQDGGNYGHICASACRLVNCVLTGNRIGNNMYDIRPIYGSSADRVTNSLNMVNCVFSKCQAGVDENWEGLVNCKQVADVRFLDAVNGDYTPSVRSVLYDAGLSGSWLLSLAGDRDVAGNPRVFAGGIDIGAYESQVNKPGFKFVIR